MTFEQFMENKIKKDIENPPFHVSVWANQFNTSVEKIIKVIYLGESVSFKGIDYVYDDVTADIVPVYLIDETRIHDDDMRSIFSN